MANENKTNDILRKRNIILTAFNISEQNFDLIIKNLEDGILSVYMHRVLTAYSKYFNKKYNKKGHVFAGPFEATLINSKDLDSMSTEIHKKPTNYREYPWSSYQDYTKENRWGDLLIVPKALQK